MNSGTMDHGGALQKTWLYVVDVLVKLFLSELFLERLSTVLLVPVRAF